MIETWRKGPREERGDGVSGEAWEKGGGGGGGRGWGGGGFWGKKKKKGGGGGGSPIGRLGKSRENGLRSLSLVALKI